MKTDKNWISEIEAFFTKWGDDISLLCKHLCYDPQDALDCFESVCVVIIKKYKTVLALEDPFPWLLKTVRNVSMQYNRKAQKRKKTVSVDEVELYEDSFEEDIIRKIDNKELVIFIKSKLNEKEIRLWEDMYIKDLSIKELSSLYKLPEQTLYSRAKSLKKKLKKFADEFYKS